MKSASPNKNVTGLWDPVRMRLADSAALGDDGAIATTHCRTKPNNHFTLTLKLTHKDGVPHLRQDVEQFMRAYMPATMKTVGCTPPDKRAHAPRHPPAVRITAPPTTITANATNTATNSSSFPAEGPGS